MTRIIMFFLVLSLDDVEKLLLRSVATVALVPRND